MKKIIFSLLLLFVVMEPVTAQNLVWSKQFSGPNSEQATSISVDAVGNVYTGGHINDTVDFEQGPGSFLLASQGSWDMYLSKQDASGNLVWAVSLGGPNIDGITEIDIDDSGNVYATGFFSATIDFDPGIGVYPLTSTGSSDIFILKLDAGGNLVWVKQVGNPYSNTGTDIELDADGNIYVGGSFADIMDFDPGLSVYNLDANTGIHGFVLKLDNSGNFLWAREVGGATTTDNNDLAVDYQSSVYLAGKYIDSADFDPGPGVFQLFAVDAYDVYVCKLDSAGNFVYARSMGGPQSEECLTLDADLFGNIYIGGFFQISCDFDPGPADYTLTAAASQDAFVVKLDASGNFSWAIQYGQSIAVEAAENLVTDSVGNVYTTGAFAGDTDFDPGPGVFLVDDIGNTDGYILKLDPDGNFITVVHLGGPSYESGRSVDFDPAGNIYATGVFMNSCDFDPGTGVYNMTAIGTSEDIFTMKLDNTTGTPEINSNKSSVLIYPSPASQTINVEYNITSTGYIEIYNTTGAKVFQQELLSSVKTITLNVSAWIKGIYYVKVMSDESLNVGKMVVK